MSIIFSPSCYLLNSFTKCPADYCAMTVLSPSKVGIAEKSSMRYGRPDQPEYPAPPRHNLIVLSASMAYCVKMDFIPDDKWCIVSISS